MEVSPENLMEIDPHSCDYEGESSDWVEFSRLSSFNLIIKVSVLVRVCFDSLLEYLPYISIEKCIASQFVNGPRRLYNLNYIKTIYELDFVSRNLKVFSLL